MSLLGEVQTSREPSFRVTSARANGAAANVHLGGPSPRRRASIKSSDSGLVPFAQTKSPPSTTPEAGSE